jgi:NADH-ubiquinone oxidoreductase chain 5
MFLILVFAPLIGCLFAGFMGRFLTAKGSAFISLLGVFSAFICSVLSFFEVGLSAAPCYIQLLPWIDSQLFDASWGFYFDSLTCSMAVVVTTVSTLVHFYSTGYMSHDPHQPRFMAYLSLFTFFMLILISADNFIQLFLGWEGVGLCSYLLINFWFTRLQANKAAIKAMVVNRVGDVGLALGVFSIFTIFRTTDYSIVFSIAPYYVNKVFSFFCFELNLLNTIGILLFIGATGKSAQIGLHTWLPDAMEGPTPVSALIHAATMVTAGVYLIIRCSPLYEYTQLALIIITIFGAMTAFMAATIGVVQNDLKKVIAYSTCSQLGYMVFVCGLSNYSVGMFHLMNHAYFKALLFLSAGSVIHSLNDEQDMRRMGGLLQILPFTYVMILVGSLALMGFPFLTGFYSKDVILEIAYAKYTVYGSFAHLLGTFSAGLTAFYSFRLVYFTFVSNANGFKTSMQNVHDAPFSLGLPLTILAFGSIFVGYITKDLFIGLGTPFWNNAIFILPANFTMIDAEFIPILIKWVPVFVSIAGATFSVLLYNWFSFSFFVLTQGYIFQKFYVFFNRKWFFDRVQNESIVKAFLYFGYDTTYKIIDKGVVEFCGPTGLSFLVKATSLQISLLQSGFIHQYAFFMFVGVVLLILKIFLWSSFFFLITDISLYFVLFLGTFLINNFIVERK